MACEIHSHSMPESKSSFLHHADFEVDHDHDHMAMVDQDDHVMAINATSTSTSGSHHHGSGVESAPNSPHFSSSSSMMSLTDSPVPSSSSSSSSGSSSSSSTPDIPMISIEESMSSSTSSLKRKSPRDRYLLQKELRHSLFGKVYMGVDNDSGRKVAIKVSIRALLKERTTLSGAKVLESPVQEASIMQMITKHKNVVGLVDVHEEEDLHWLAQEYIGGGELFDHLLACPNGHFTDGQARNIFIQLITGMNHIHQRGVAHLDLSLENMLVDMDGTIKICDFGLARPFARGEIMKCGDSKPGKLGYMAPEIFRGDNFEGDKADIFSAGVILFTALTGHPPFEFASRDDRRFAMIADGQLSKMLHVLKMDSRVCPSACDLLSRMFSENPADRPSLHFIASHPWVRGIKTM